MSTPSRLSEARRHALNTGTAACAHLSECLSVDFACLLAHVAPHLPAQAWESMRTASGKGITARMAHAAHLLRTHSSGDAQTWRTHVSDTVRGWACYLIANQPGASLDWQLSQLRPLADDAHFGVREWAWLAVRPAIVAQPLAALALLLPWADARSEHLRRYACEALRPRGVWAAHIAVFKQTPALALPLLEKLANDPARYVQDSVANWLNDAGKTQPAFVHTLAADWANRYPGPANAYIRRRALRRLP